MDSNATRGTKRKRYEPAEEPISARIAGKLHHQVKEVHKASKTAKAQETQKVVKRLKDIRKKDPSDAGIEGFEAELTTLKEIDHDAVGNSAFKTKILKDHTLKSNSDVTNAMTKEFANHFLVPAEPGTTLAKIQSRLLSSKILATQISASVDSLKILLNPALKQALASTADSVEQSSSSSRQAKSLKSSASSSGPAGASNKSNKSKGKPDDDDDDDDEGMDEDGDKDDDDDVSGESDSSRDFGGWESGSVDGEGAAGDDDGWESGSVGSAAGQYHSGDEDEDEDSDEDENDSDSDNEDLKVNAKRAKTQPAKAPATKATAKPAAAKSTAKPTKTTASNKNKMESTFLPSLAVGFVRGSDDSDFSDTEAQDADMPKKNRRGQRARRLIWEKKFGRNANHKKKEAELAAAQAAKSKNSGHTSSKIRSGSNAISALPATPASTMSTAARGTAAGWGTAAARGPPATGKGFARGGGDRAPPLQGNKGKYTTTTAATPVDAGWGGRSAGVPAPAAPSRPGRGPPTKADEKPLHPSWEAKRKLKEKESAGIVPSQGVKIKFS